MMRLLKQIVGILFSNKLMAILFILFPLAMGIATFIENDYDTETSKVLIYNTWWFELMLLLFAINFIGNIFKYRLHRPKKWIVLSFHLAFVLILVGAAITRYISYEGIMPIKEGTRSNQFLSETTYLTITIDNNREQRTLRKKVLFSAKKGFQYELNTDFRGQKVNFSLVGRVQNAKEAFVMNPNGEEYLKFVESSGGGRHEHYIKKGSLESIHGVLVGFEAQENATVNFTKNGDRLKIFSAVDGTYFKMQNQKKGTITSGINEDFMYLTLYRIGSLNFVVPDPPVKGVMEFTQDKNDPSLADMLTFKVSSKGISKNIEVTGAQYLVNDPAHFELAGLNFRIAYGAIERKLPFFVRLKKFELERYPGSESAKSYNSLVTVIDGNKKFDYLIFMNHILDHGGYRFFQSSYDVTDDYRETRLSVNHDEWGTKITYTGYFFLFMGLILSMLTKNTRFDYLRKKLRNVRKTQSKLTILMFFLATAPLLAQTQIPTHSDPAQQPTTEEINEQHDHGTSPQKASPVKASPIKRLTPHEIDSILRANIVAKKHSEAFSRLIIQDAGGRMKPIHTFASELLRKATKKDHYKGFTASQILLSIMQYPFFWYQVPIVHLEQTTTKGYINGLLGLPKNQKYGCLFDFVDEQGNYIIRDLVSKAQKKSIKSNKDKKLIVVDKRISLLYQAISGDVFRLFPIPKNPMNKWVAQPQVALTNLKGIDSVFVKQVLPVYRQTLFVAQRKGDYTDADKILEGIANYQKKHGAAVYPTARKINLEILYNKYDVFKSLFAFLMMASTFMFIFVLLKIFWNNRLFKYAVNGCKVVIWCCFIAHTAGLIARAFISGHAPWSDGYESMIYVSWATLLFGLVFGRKSDITLAATGFITSMILMIAHWNWMDPEIANLPPVLNSYWLMIHVAIIVGSYGPLTLCMMIGTITLILWCLMNRSNRHKLNNCIKELTIINEMSMTLGVAMLTIGNFLGGMWANESWGRYWGWDPKETWALISIMIYALVLHLRLIPKLKNTFLFNTCSLLAFASIMMTYFGVNFYLSGKHSYASGEQIITPNFVFYTLGIVFVLISIAYWRKYLAEKLVFRKK